MTNILLVEDLEESQLIVSRALAGKFNLVIAATVRDGVANIRSPKTKFDLVILDYSLPDGEGLVVLEEIRGNQTYGESVPVLMLTSRSGIDDKLAAFNMGVDDYLVKPVNGLELRARVENRLKRMSSQAKPQTTLKKGELSLDITGLQASIKDAEITKVLDLTAKEFKILVLLMQNENKVFSRAELVKSVWGNDVHILERTVDSHIFSLRKKMGTCSDYIESIPNAGYRFVVRAL